MRQRHIPINEQIDGLRTGIDFIKTMRTAARLHGFHESDTDEILVRLSALLFSSEWTLTHKDKLECAWNCNKNRKDCDQ